MQFDLIPHPATPPSQPLKLWATVDYAGAFGVTATANIWFGIGAPAKRFVIPSEGEDGAERRDGLWRNTCFEAFLRIEGESAYREWNFAPSGDWAVYDFAAPREGMAKPGIAAPPYIRMEDNLTWWALGATIALDAGRQWELGLSAVLEERDGTKSYWALTHGGNQPDFHDPACFTARLA